MTSAELRMHEACFGAQAASIEATRSFTATETACFSEGGSFLIPTRSMQEEEAKPEGDATKVGQGASADKAANKLEEEEEEEEEEASRAMAVD